MINMPDLHLFEGYGVELEYMIVDRESLQVLPVADKLLEKVSGELTDIFENGVISWCNELALHVIEFKTTGPAPHLKQLNEAFQENIHIANEVLSSMGGMLLPTAMHPLMDPYKELKIWPHGQNEIYEKYNKIFDCKGHGWANLQSVHLNLPFSNDEEFERLHAAIRLILPLLPAIAASSPIVDGQITDFKDSRMNVYMSNQKRIPSITGKIIPEQVWNKKDYYQKILEQNYKDISLYDPEGLLQEEWLNSRGAIARFSRMAIEVRVLDIQECPAADLAILKLIVNIIQSLVKEQWSPIKEQKAFHENDLFNILQDCISAGEKALIYNQNYLKALGIFEEESSAKDVWTHLLKNASGLENEDKEILSYIIKEGCLSTRIEKAIGKDISKGRIKEVYSQLALCLQNNNLFKI